MRIAMLGFGTVGRGAYEMMIRKKDLIQYKYDRSLDIVAILVRNLDRYADEPHAALFTTDFQKILDARPDVVIEAMGGIETAYRYAHQILSAGIHYITANKDMMAEHGDELLNLARAHHVTIKYEAAVGGGIPVIKPIKESLVGNRIDRITAILNGTSNYILSQMDREGLAFETVLEKAQALGFAEADPSSDVEGTDAARKLAILTRIAFIKKVDLDQISKKGITGITKADILAAKDLGYTIKLIAHARLLDDCIYATVQPMFIPADSLIGHIANENNGIMVRGDAVGDVFFYGKGAGKDPTGSAIFSDLVDLMLTKQLEPLYFTDRTYTIAKLNPLPSKWYLRIHSDEPLDRAVKLIEAFGDRALSIETDLAKGATTLIVEGVDEETLLSKLSVFSNDQITRYLILEEE